MGLFLATVAARLDGTDLPGLLAAIEAAPRPRARDLASAVDRVARLREAWLGLPPLRAHNTCYIRALTLYRFVDPGQDRMRIHFGVEPGQTPSDRLRGHAWITVGDGIVEAPDAVLAGRVREMYIYPGARPSVRSVVLPLAHPG
jgi:hypothetical protein